MPEQRLHYALIRNFAARLAPDEAEAVGIFPMRPAEAILFGGLPHCLRSKTPGTSRSRGRARRSTGGVLREVLAIDGMPCALFVDVNDADAFAAAVRQALHDGNLRDSLMARGAALSERYSLDDMVGRYAALIR